MGILYAFLASLGFCILFNVRGSRMFFAALGGGIGWAVYLLTAPLFTNDIPQYFLATIAIAIYAEISARIQKVPTSIFLAPAFIPLVPGGGIYATMEACIAGENAEFMSNGVHTLGIAVSLALGLAIVSSVTRVIRTIHFRRRQKRS